MLNFNRLYWLIIFSLLSCSSRNNTWLFSKVDSSRLLFTNGHAVETNLFDLQYIGQIPLNTKEPLFIFSGRDCQGCDENISIYMHSPSDSPLDVEAGKNRYHYPGKESDYETDSLFYTSRAFYGQVLKNTIGVIWYENRLLENGHWDQDVFLSRMDHDIQKDTIYYNQGDLKQTLDLVKQGLCREIEGRQYKSEP
jgi:hypothetical protein